MRSVNGIEPLGECNLGSKTDEISYPPPPPPPVTHLYSLNNGHCSKLKSQNILEINRKLYVTHIKERSGT
jgi:hypothetical protein